MRPPGATASLAVRASGRRLGSSTRCCGGYIKSHPTCAHLHGVNDAVADLLAARADWRDVAAVGSGAFADAARFDAVAGGELAARFSVPTSVAVALLFGRLDETTLTDELVRLAAVRDLAARVRSRTTRRSTPATRAGRPARVGSCGPTAAS